MTASTSVEPQGRSAEQPIVLPRWSYGTPAGAVVWYASQMPRSAAAKTLAATTKPPTTGERPDLEECIARWREGRDQEALYEAARRYDGDLAAELAAVEAGTHPLQERQRRVRR